MSVFTNVVNMYPRYLIIDSPLVRSLVVNLWKMFVLRAKLYILYYLFVAFHDDRDRHNICSNWMELWMDIIML